LQVPFGEELLGNYSGIRDRALQEKGQVVRARHPCRRRHLRCPRRKGVAVMNR